MIESSQAPLLPNCDVLTHLLHSLCQPLTTLRCSLELSLDEFAGRQCEPVSVALEQADRAVETVQLIREYLELERGKRPVGSVALTPSVHTVLGQLGIVAEAYRVPRFAFGTSMAVLTLNEFWLHRALRYLIGSTIEDQPPGNAVAILLEDHRSTSVLSVHSLPFGPFTCPETEPSRVPGHLLQAKLAIAQRVFESAGASLHLYKGEQRSGF